MIASHEWLKAFVPHGLPPADVGRLLGAHAATLDSAEALRADLAPFVVGQVVHSERIPETRLSFNRVDDGSGELLEVVCGAPNVEVGAKYPLARVGTVVPGKGGMTIERRKIRGYTSAGMLCSAAELGLGADHDGILALHTDAAPGTPILDVLAAGDVRFEFDVLANRPDLLSQRGLARELAALAGVALRRPDELGAPPPLPAAAAGAREAAAGGVTVRVDDAEGCPRYCAAVIRGVRVGPSPDWLVQRLAGVGARSINNVVDATNYALHGLGQPVHAFDLARLAGATVVVRRAGDGERLTTLDGAERTLGPDALVIADAERAQAVAGVMGGRDSEVVDATTDVLLEVAYFDPRRARASRKRAGVSTDGSYRFERGVDRAATLDLLADTASLVVAVAGGAVDAVFDVGAAPGALPPVRLRAARVARVLGHPVPDAEIERVLASVGFAPARADAAQGEGAVWAVGVPPWRHDVTLEVDLIEEVARLVGFDALPDDLRPFRPGTVPDHPLVAATRRVREALVADGLLEARPLPFVRGDDATHPRVANPLAEDEPHLRGSALDTLARRAEYNLSRMQGDVRLFEVGSVFARAPRPGALPVERLVAAALVMGARRPPHFSDPKPPAFDVWDAKALGERIARAAFPGAVVALAPAAGAGPHGGALWTVTVDRREAGVVRRVALDAPVWAAPAYGVEVALGVVESAPVAAPGANIWPEAVDAQAGIGAAAHVRYRPLPTTPAAEIDLALVVPDAVPAADVEALLRRFGGDTLEAVAVLDEFRGGDVPAGARSLLWRLTLRDPARTLRQKEVDGRRQKLVQALERELGVRVRAG